MSPWWIALICAIAIIWLYSRARQEDFATPAQKASVLYGWISTHPKAPYSEFIRANPESNILEYTEGKRMLAIKGLSETERLSSITKAFRI